LKVRVDYNSRGALVFAELGENLGEENGERNAERFEGLGDR